MAGSSGGTVVGIMLVSLIDHRAFQQARARPMAGGRKVGIAKDGGFGSILQVCQLLQDGQSSFHCHEPCGYWIAESVAPSSADTVAQTFPRLPFVAASARSAGTSDRLALVSAGPAHRHDPARRHA